MRRASREKAIDLLTDLARRARALSSSDTTDEHFKLWRNEGSGVLRNLFGDGSPQLTAFQQISFTPISVAMVHRERPFEAPRSRRPIDDSRGAMQRGLSTACALLEAHAGEVRHFWDDSEQGPTLDALTTVIRICDGLPRAIARLGVRRTGRSKIAIRDEYDVHYVLGALLGAHFGDVRPEDPAPSDSGASSRLDYLLKPERIAIETKMTRKGLADREVGDQLLVDIGRYQSRADCDALVCLVYDPRRLIVNPRGLERDLEAKTIPALKVRVVVRS